MGTTNLNAILGSQNCVFEKAGISYQFGFLFKENKGNTVISLKQMSNSFHPP